MKRNFSAKSTGFKLQPQVFPNAMNSDSMKTLQLKSRLFERGISANPLPSVKKPRVSQSAKKLQTAATLASMPSSKLILRPTSTRTSVTGFTSIGALRPSSAIKISKIPASLTTRTANQPARPDTARTNISAIQKVNTSRSNIEIMDSARAANLIEKLTNRPKTARRDINTPIQEEVIEVFQEPFKEEIKDYYIDDYREETKIDQFIRLIKEGKTEENEFVYLLRCPITENYDYAVISAAQARNESNESFYTLSAKGLSLFIAGSPVEFVKFSDFLIERRHFFNMQRVSFFKQFRV